MKERWLLNGLTLVLCLLLLSVGNVMAQIDYCEGNFDYDKDVDGTDAGVFKTDFGRSQFSNPCPPNPPTPLLPSGQTTSYYPFDDGDTEIGYPQFRDITCWQDCDPYGCLQYCRDLATELIWYQYNTMWGILLLTWEFALDACNTVPKPSLCNNYPGNLSYPRIPNIRELLTLVNYGSYGPATLPLFSPLDDPNTQIWTSTTLAGASGSAWYVYTWNGDTGMAWKSDTKVWLCVCGGKDE